MPVRNLQKTKINSTSIDKLFDFLKIAYLQKTLTEISGYEKIYTYINKWAVVKPVIQDIGYTRNTISVPIKDATSLQKSFFSPAKFSLFFSDAYELSSARFSQDSARAVGFSARLGSARLVRFLSQPALQIFAHTSQNWKSSLSDCNSDLIYK